LLRAVNITIIIFNINMKYLDLDLERGSVEHALTASGGA
jgi:hypothetical protein